MQTEGPSRRSLLLGGAAAALMALRAGGVRAGMTSRQSILEREIPSTGERVPAIGLGTWQTFDVGAGAQRAPLRTVLDRFVALGGRVIDSSPMYGRSEDVTGDLAADAGLHDRLFIATKVWTRGREEGIAQMEASMRKLRVERVDLMQVHNLLDARTHLDTLAGWKREGRIRYLGVTHYAAGAHADLERAMREHPLDFVQVNLSVAERGASRTLLPLAAERGIAVMINRPFAEGALFRAVRGRALPAWAAELQCRTWAQLFLKFILSHPAVTVAIPATTRVDHLRENKAAARGPMPDEAARAEIVAAFEAL